jgi:predicted Fe-Mo cluster-binding NifX family protein
MKTVISSLGDNEDAQFDLRFGRAAFFCIYDEDTKNIEFINNVNKDAQGGAGTKTVETMIELGVQKVISGDFGPKAQDLLEKFNIQMVVIQDDNITIKDILNKIS